MADLFERYRESNAVTKQLELSLENYLQECSDDPSYYAGPAERLLKAIGEPIVVDTNQDPRLGRIFSDVTMKTYPGFGSDFYGMELIIERVVGFFRHAAQGLEERKQVLYLLGPVGGGKSSLAERLKFLMEKEPVYVLKAGKEISPVFESPLGLFDPTIYGDELEQRYKIPKQYLGLPMSPWAVKRLDEFGGDPTKFTVVRMQPSRLKQICIAKTEPGDENNQDVASLVGKVEIRKLEHHSQNDPDAYNFSGGLNRTNQGLLEFVEMFKAPIKMLHPLLTATQEGNYAGTENIGSIPFQGIILAHSNEAEWQTFKGNKNNEAFLDRISVIKVPYCLRKDEERSIYLKLLKNSQLARAPCSPSTLDMLAEFCILSRIKPGKVRNREGTGEIDVKLYDKMRVYNGEDPSIVDIRASTAQNYRDAAGVDEGMDGISTRFAFKVLSAAFNLDAREVAADPVHLMYVLDQAIVREQFPDDTGKEKRYRDFIKADLAPRFAEFLGHEIQKAFLESYDNVGQNTFETYVGYADCWYQDRDYKNPRTGELMRREHINLELQKVEKPAGIPDPSKFRQEIINFCLRARPAHGGKDPPWTSHERVREMIEKKVFSPLETLLPVISFGNKKDSETQEKHEEFVKRMVLQGYTMLQVHRLVDWYIHLNSKGG